MLVVLVVLANRAFQVYQTWQTHVCIPSLVNLISVMIRCAEDDGQPRKIAIRDLKVKRSGTGRRETHGGQSTMVQVRKSAEGLGQLLF